MRVFVLCGAGILLLLPIVILGVNAFPQPADEFCYASWLKQHGLWGLLEWRYQTWTGRYVEPIAYGTFLVYFDLVRQYWLLPIGALVFQLFAATLAAAAIFAGVLKPAGVFVIGLFVTALIQLGQPAPQEGIFWLGSALLCQSGCSLLLILLACIAWHARWAAQTRRFLPALAAACVAFLIAGTYEPLLPPAALMLLAGFYLHLLLSLPVSGIVLPAISLAAGTYLLLSAPGNEIRIGVVGAPLLVSGILKALGTSTVAFFQWATDPKLWMASLLAIPVIARAHRHFPQPTKRQIALTLLCAFCGVFAVWSAPFIVAGRSPPRVDNIAYFTFLLGWGATLAVASPTLMAQTPLSRMSEKRWLAAFGLLMICFLTHGNFPNFASDSAHKMPAYRKLMRARYARISEAQRKDERTLVVTGMRSVMESIYFRDLTPDPANGRNRCVAEYFGLASIATDEPNPTQRNPGEP